MRFKLVFVALLMVLPSITFASDLSDLSIPVSDFELKDSAGNTVRLDDLRGKVWIGSFIVFICPDGKCPQVTQTMERLQEKFKNRSDVRLVTFVVDSALHKPEDLATLPEKYHADPNKWLFLTGSQETIDRVQESLFLKPKKDSNDKIPHSQRLIVVDRKGNMRGFYLGLKRLEIDDDEATRDLENDLRKLKKQVDKLLAPELPAWMPADFPAFNASLNALAGALLLLGYYAIRRRWIRVHITLMLTAIVVSAVFLTSYLFYHIVIKQGEPTRFSDQAPDAPAWVGYLYLAILGSHTLLAVPTAPAALWLAWLGWKNKLQNHVRLARWVFPVWVYVSITGVVVYWMLYRLYPS